MQPGPRISLSAGLAALVLGCLCLGCDELDSQVVGQAAGFRSDTPFGRVVRLVDLSMRKRTGQRSGTRRPRPRLPGIQSDSSGGFGSPAASSSLVVSTDPTAVSPGARREYLDDALLVRINTDPTFMTAPWPPSPKSMLEVHAMTPGSSTDIAGTADIPLNGRFDLDVGQADVYGHPAKLSEFRCLGDHHRAWQPSNAARRSARVRHICRSACSTADVPTGILSRVPARMRKAVLAVALMAPASSCGESPDSTQPPTATAEASTKTTAATEQPRSAEGLEATSGPPNSIAEPRTRLTRPHHYPRLRTRAAQTSGMPRRTHSSLGRCLLASSLAVHRKSSMQASHLQATRSSARPSSTSSSIICSLSLSKPVHTPHNNSHRVA